MVSFVKLGKPFSSTLIGMVVVAFAFFSSSIFGIGISSRYLILITISTVLCGKFISIHNDIVDYECDSKDDKKGNKPLVSGVLSTKEAWCYAAFTFCLSLILASRVSIAFFVVIVVLLIDGYIYNTWGKPKGHIFGNLQVSLATASVVPIGAMVVTQGRFDCHIIILLMPCFIIAFAYETFREITNATMDLQGDSSVNYKTLPLVVGAWKARGIGWFFMLMTVSLLWVSMGFGWGILYSIGATATSVLTVSGVLCHGYVMRYEKDVTKRRKFEVWYRHYLRLTILVFLFFVLFEGML